MVAKRKPKAASKQKPKAKAKTTTAKAKAPETKAANAATKATKAAPKAKKAPKSTTKVVTAKAATAKKATKAKASTGKAAMSKGSVGRAAMSKASAGKATMSKGSVGKASVGKASAGKASAGKASAGKASSRKSATKTKARAKAKRPPAIAKTQPVKAQIRAIVKLPAAKKSKTTRRKSEPAFEPYTATQSEDYMNESQRNHFRNILLNWKHELMEGVDRTVVHMQEEAANYPDPTDRASQEEEFALELKARDRERLLIKKIDHTIDLIDQDEYGFCSSCGVEIGIRRLEARPTATQCIDCKTLGEIKERQILG
jgi:DnaK suppressor protein